MYPNVGYSQIVSLVFPDGNKQDADTAYAHSKHITKCLKHGKLLFLILEQYCTIQVVSLSSNDVIINYIYCLCCHMHIISLLTFLWYNQDMVDTFWS